MTRKTLFIAVAGILLLAFAGAAILYQGGGLGDEKQTVLLRDGAPIKGPVDAKVTIVEFFDPACGTCRQFYPLVRKLIKKYPGKVRVMMRYAPLHPGSDQVVVMMEAAHRQGKFWQTIEALFRRQNQWVVNHKSQPVRALTVLGTLGLDRDQLAADMKSPEVAQAIQQDVQDGQTLGVRATPEFFVNGRPMPEFSLEALARLVKEAVAEAY